MLVAIFAPLIAPYAPTDGSFEPLEPPSGAHLLGTNVGGQDIFSQLIYGARVSLLVGLLGGTLATLIALVIGMISGYAEGTIVDDILSFFTSVALVIPVLPLIITLVAYSEDARYRADRRRHRHHLLGRRGPGQARPDHHAAQPRLRHRGEVLR